MKSVRKHLTYANVMASLAVFLILGGGAAVAAGGLGKNTVGSKQLKKNAVTAVKVKDGSLLGADFAAGQLPAGATGPAGAKGATGAAGPAGVIAANSVNSSHVVDASLTAADLGPNSVGQSEIQTDGVAATEIEDNAIDGGEIVNAGLSDVDVGNASGTFVFDAPSIAANQCTLQTPTVAGVDNLDHVIVSPPAAIMALNLSVTAGQAASPGFIRLNFCNPTGVAIDPASATFAFVTINQ